MRVGSARHDSTESDSVVLWTPGGVLVPRSFTHAREDDRRVRPCPRLRATSPRMDVDTAATPSASSTPRPARPGASRPVRPASTPPRHFRADDGGAADADRRRRSRPSSESRSDDPSRRSCVRARASGSAQVRRVRSRALAACFGVLSPHVVDHPWLLRAVRAPHGHRHVDELRRGPRPRARLLLEASLVGRRAGHLTHSPLLAPFYPWAVLAQAGTGFTTSRLRTCRTRG